MATTTNKIVKVISFIMFISILAVACLGMVTLNDMQTSTGLGFVYGQAVTANDAGLTKIACEELKETDKLANQLAGFPHKYINSFTGMKKLRQACRTTR